MAQATDKSKLELELELELGQKHERDQREEQGQQHACDLFAWPVTQQWFPAPVGYHELRRRVATASRYRRTYHLVNPSQGRVLEPHYDQPGLDIAVILHDEVPPRLHGLFSKGACRCQAGLVL